MRRLGNGAYSLIALGVVLASGSAAAQGYGDDSPGGRGVDRLDEPGTPAVPDVREVEHQGPTPLATGEDSEWDHLELSMGFIAGGRRYGDLAFQLDHGPDTGLDASVFEASPFDSVEVMGLRYDVRLVVSYVRMTAGVDIPFADLSSQRTSRVVEGRVVTVEGLRPRALHFGIGGEYPFGAVAPFVDLLGNMHWVVASLDVDGARSSYKASGFAFTARGGVRLHVREWFFASASAEVGIVGPVRWGAELSVGFAVL